MWMTYTLYSRVMDAEETVTLLMPNPHQVQNGQYTIEDLYEKRRELPVLFAMGDEGTENNWWMRSSFAEADIHKNVCAVVCLRGMPMNKKTLRFVKEELPTLLCSQFPFDRNKMGWLSWKRSEVFCSELMNSSYKKVMNGGAKDNAEVMQQAIRELTKPSSEKSE